MNSKQLVKRLFVLVGLIVISLIVKYVMLGGLSPTTLGYAQPLAGTLAPSIANKNINGGIPEAGEDFKITGAKYFDNQAWAVVGVTSIPDNNPSTLILKKQGGIFRVVLGPGTSFPASAELSMPNDVNAYLTTKGLVYED